MTMWHKHPEIPEKKVVIDTTKTVKQAGKEINWKKYTQENNVDLNIYEVRNTYDGQYRNRLKIDPEAEELLVDHTDTLEKMADRIKAANNQWLALPADVRREFNYDVNEFIDRGKNWLKEKTDKIKAEKAEREKLQKQAAKKAEAYQKAQEQENEIYQQMLAEYKSKKGLM